MFAGVCADIPHDLFNMGVVEWSVVEGDGNVDDVGPSRFVRGVIPSGHVTACTGVLHYVHRAREVEVLR